MSFTLQQYIENLQKLIDDDPDLALAEVWTASDEEGNNYQAIGFTPSLRLIERTETHSTEFARCYESEFDDLAAEVGVYEDDFETHSDYLQEATLEISKEYKVVVLVN